MQLQLKPTLKEVLTGRGAGKAALTGLWVASGSPVAAEIMAGSGAELILVDGEHSPVTVASLVPLLQALEPYPVTALVRVPWNDPVLIKQFLDTGAQNLMVPMVGTPEQAQAAVAAVRYPGAGETAHGTEPGAVVPGDADRATEVPGGVRGIGAALARASRWGRVPGYVARAHELVSLTVQVETVEGARNAAAIASVEGVDAVFIGPADLAASMGLATTPTAPEVLDLVEQTIRAVKDSGTPVGVNAFDRAVAQRYREAGADFVFVSADVTLMVKGSDAVVATVKQGADAESGEPGGAESY